MHQILLVACMVTVMSIVIHIMRKHACDNVRKIVSLAFGVYVVSYLYFTLLSRDIGSISFVDLHPLKTYSRLFETATTPIVIVTGFMADYLQGTPPIVSLILNILLYYPLGYLLPILFPQLKPKHVILIGCLCSIATEATQYLLKMGWCETDDVIHNTLGTAIGVWIWHLQSKRLNKPKSNELPKE